MFEILPTSSNTKRRDEPDEIVTFFDWVIKHYLQNESSLTSD